MPAEGEAARSGVPARGLPNTSRRVGRSGSPAAAASAAKSIRANTVRPRAATAASRRAQASATDPRAGSRTIPAGTGASSAAAAGRIGSPPSMPVRKSVAIFMLCSSEPQGAAQGVRAAPQRLLLFVRHDGLENPLDAGAPDDAGQGKRYAVCRVEGTDRDHRTLVAQDDLRDAGAHHADAV